MFSDILIAVCMVMVAINILYWQHRIGDLETHVYGLKKHLMEQARERELDRLTAKKAPVKKSK